MQRNVLAAVCALAVTAALAACGGSDEDSGTAAQPTTTGTTAAKKSSDPMKIAFFAPASANAYFAAEAKAGEEWAKANGAEFTVVDAGFDMQKQLNQIQDATATKKYNAYVVFAAVGPIVAPALEKAAEGGIPVALVASTVTSDFSSTEPGVPWLAGRVAQPPAARGAALAEQVIAACEGIDPCEVVYLFTIAGDPQEKVIIDSFNKGLEGHPNIKRLKDRGPAMAQRGPAAKVTQDLLQAEPGVDVIASLDQSIAGAEVALKQAGKAYGTGDGEVRLVGIGATKHAVDSVKAGRWFSTQSALPDDEMVMALDMLKQAHDGELAEPKGVDPTTAGEYPVALDKQAIEDTGFQAQYDG